MTDDQKVDIEKSIAWCKEQRAHALQMVKDFDKGEKHFRRAGIGPLEDVTQKHREQYVQIAERMKKLISAYEKLIL